MTAADWVHIIDAMEIEKVDPQEIGRKDHQWTKLWDERWYAVEDWWRSYLHMNDLNTDTETLRGLLKKLQEIVPPKTLTNGTEQCVEYAHPNDVPAHIKGAARILFEGELECVAEGDNFLLNGASAWENVLVDMRRKMSILLKEDEVTEGETSMSRKSHASATLDALDSVEFARKAFLIDDTTDTETSFETDVLHQLSAELALFAFSAGVHARYALGKEVERWAVIGHSELPVIKERLAGARRGGQNSADKAKVERLPLMEEMHMRIEEGQTITAAALNLHKKKEGLGKSVDSLRKMWTTHSKEFLAERK